MDKINSTLIYAITYYKLRIFSGRNNIASSTNSIPFLCTEKILVNLSNRPLDKFMRLICVL